MPVIHQSIATKVVVLDQQTMAKITSTPTFGAVTRDPGLVAVERAAPRPFGVGAVGPQGPQGPAGEAEGATFTVPAASAVHARRVVCVGASGAYHPDLDNPDDARAVVGIATTSASVAGEMVVVRTAGRMTDSGWGWSPGFVWCGPDGVLTQGALPSGWIQRVGRVTGPTSFEVDIDTPLMRVP